MDCKIAKTFKYRKGLRSFFKQELKAKVRIELSHFGTFYRARISAPDGTVLNSGLVTIDTYQRHGDLVYAIQKMRQQYAIRVGLVPQRLEF